jgi:hypothetical protein
MGPGFRQDDDGERCPTGKSVFANPKRIPFVQSSRAKYASSEFRKIMVLSAIPPRREGRMRIVTTREAGSDGRGRYRQTYDTDADGEAVWS